MYQTPPKDSRQQECAGRATSPTVRTRVMEKEELSGLNDRLAVYIDRMRHLEQQNSMLSAEIKTSKDGLSREIGNVKSIYEAELKDTRKMIDDFAKEKALLHMENQKMVALLDELRLKLDKETKNRIRADDELKRTDRRLHEKESLLLIVSKERKQLDDRVKELESELKKITDDLEKQKKLLENEIIKRLSAENRVQTLEEEAAFNRQTHANEMTTLRSSMESYRVTIDSSSNEYDGLIHDKLQELRDEFEEEAQNAKNELESAYQVKFDDMRRSQERDNDQARRLSERNLEMKTELDKLMSDYNILEANNVQLQKRIKDLQNLRQADREEFKVQLQTRDGRIRSLEDDLLRLEKEYETLLGVKIALDIEIAAYRKLIEGEEERLNIPGTSGGNVADSCSVGRSGSKRRRNDEIVSEIENVTSGSLEVEECDPHGRFIRIKNNSNEDAPLGGFYVKRILDNQNDDVIEYKFTPKFVLKSEKNVTIWSQSAGVKQKAPTDLVLKNSDWKVPVKSAVTSMFNSEDEVIAKQTVRIQSAASSTRRPRRERRGTNPDACSVM